MVADSGAYLCLMHMLGAPRTMQDNPVYDDVVSDIKSFLEERLAFAIAAGVREDHICLDPGIGFGKTVEQNFELVRRLDELVAIGRPLLIGFSRKSSLGRIVGDPAARTGASQPRSGPRSAPTSAALRSSACTTSASMSKPSPSRKRWRSADRRAARPRALRLPRGSGGREAARPAVRLRPVARRRRARGRRRDRPRRRLPPGRRSGARGERTAGRPARGARVADGRRAHGGLRAPLAKVRVRKPQVRPAGLPVEFSAVTVERSSEGWRPSPT